MKTLKCDIGGNYWYPQIPGPAKYIEPCPNTPVIRWRGEGFVEGHWNGRCAEHAKWLDGTDGLTIENL